MVLLGDLTGIKEYHSSALCMKSGWDEAVVQHSIYLYAGDWAEMNI